MEAPIHLGNENSAPRHVHQQYEDGRSDGPTLALHPASRSCSLHLDLTPRLTTWSVLLHLLSDSENESTTAFFLSMDANVDSESNRCAQNDVSPLGAPLFDNDDDNDFLDSEIDYLALVGPPPPFSPRFRNVAMDNWLDNCTECNALTGPPPSSPPWPSSPPFSLPPPSDIRTDDDTADNSSDLNLTPGRHKQHDPTPRSALAGLQIDLPNQFKAKSPCDVIFVDFQYCTDSSTSLLFALARLDDVLLGSWHIELNEIAVQHQLARINEDELDRFENAQFVYRSRIGHVYKELYRMRELYDADETKWVSLQPPIIAPIGNNEPALPTIAPMGNHEPAPPTIVPIDDDELILGDVWILSDDNSIRQLKHLSLLYEGLDSVSQHLRHIRKEDELILRHESVRDIVKALLPITSTRLDSVRTLLIPDPVHLQRELQPHRAVVAVEMISQVVKALFCRCEVVRGSSGV